MTDITKVKSTDSNWPIVTYLAGEIYLKRKDVSHARKQFKILADWAYNESKDPRKSQWGGNGLAAIALWRWLQIIDRDGGDSAEKNDALNVVDMLCTTRMYNGMTQSGLLPALPLVEEDIARLSAEIAFNAKRPEAMSRFLDFVGIDSKGDLDAVGQQIQKEMISNGFATEDRLTLYHSRRQLNLITTKDKKQEAADTLKKLWSNESTPPDVRAEAGYEWAYFNRQDNSDKKEIVNVLTSAFELEGKSGPTAEKALYRRGMVQNSLAPKRPALFFQDMSLVLSYPHGQLANDALYETANEHLFGADPNRNPDQAFAEFEMLRKSPENNRWMDSAYLEPALGLIERGGNADLKNADQLLKEYVDNFPEGAFRLRSIFWRGRIAELNHDPEGANRFFTSLIKEAPYDYYGLRASMHLHSKLGENPISMPLPSIDSETYKLVRTAYQSSKPSAELDGSTPYHDRLRAVVSNGLYANVLSVVEGIQKISGQRVDNIPLQDLNEKGQIPATALLLSFRQDVLTARGSSLTADNLLRLAGFVGQNTGDWPVVLELTSISEGSSPGLIQDIQNDPRFLSTYFPNREALPALNQALANAAWPIDGSVALSQSLMYGVMREESHFYSDAISQTGALGLFQIMPTTFRTLDCPKGKGPTLQPVPYLFNPDNNAKFWSCLAQTDLGAARRADIATALAKHHAGAGTFNDWKTEWTEPGIKNDLELQIDTYRIPATSSFVRSTLRDIAIADAGGFFKDDASAVRRNNP